MNGARTRGFTLLEIMAALVVFMVGVVGVLALFASGLALHNDASRRALAAQAAEQARTEIERRLATWPATEPFPDALEGEPLAGRPGWFFDAALEADPDAGTAGGVYARVKVFTMDVGKEKGETFRFFLRPRATPEESIRAALRGAAEPAHDTTPAPGG